MLILSSLFLPNNQPRCALGIWTSNISALIFHVLHSIITAGARWLLFRFPTRAGHLSVPCGTGPRRYAFAPVFHMLSNINARERWFWLGFPTCVLKELKCTVPCGTGPRRWALAPVFHMLSNMNHQGTMVSAALSYMWRSTS